MKAQGTLQILRAMNLNAMAAEYEKQLSDPKAFEKHTFDERMAFLVDAQWIKRQTTKLNKYVRNAMLPNSSAVLEEIEYYPDRKLDKSRLWEYATGKYIDDGLHIIIKGASGCGKTYIACALGIAACRKFKKVRYVRLPELLDEFKILHVSNEFRKGLSEYKKVDLLIIDDWLLRKLNAEQAHDVMELVESRSQSSKRPGGLSTIFCTQYNESEWYERILQPEDENAPETDSILDRIVHNAYVIQIEGMSMRQRHGLDAPSNQTAMLDRDTRGSAPNPGV